MLNYLSNINLMYSIPNDKLTTFLVSKALTSSVKCANQASADYLSDITVITSEVMKDVKSATQVQPSDLIGIEQDNEEQDIRFI